MTNTKKILITTESREVFFVRVKSKSHIRGFCADCAAETEMLTLDEAMRFARQSTREIVRRAENGDIHFLETANGHLLVCRASFK
jgi:hypothetical protein